MLCFMLPKHEYKYIYPGWLEYSTRFEWAYVSLKDYYQKLYMVDNQLPKLDVLLRALFKQIHIGS